MAGGAGTWARAFNLNDGCGKETVVNARRSVRLVLWGLDAALLCTAPAMAQYEPVLTLEGTCPEFLRAEVSGAPPRHGLSLLFASETGTFRVPDSFYCAGVILGLGRRNLRDVAAGTTDEFGFIAFEGSVGERACGGYLQVLTFPLAGR